MNLRFNQLSPEFLAMRTRWALIATAAVLLMDELSEPGPAILLGLLAVSNFVALRALKKDAKRTPNWIPWLRVMDGILLAATTFWTSPVGEQAWMLAAPLLIVHGLTAKEKMRPLLLATVMSGMAVGSGYLLHRDFIYFAPAIGVFLGSALFGITLNGFQGRENKLTKRDRRLGSVLSCGSALADHADLRQMMLHTLKTAVLETKATCGYVMLTDQDSDQPFLHPEVAFGDEGEFEFPERIELGSGLSGYVGRMGQPVTVSSKEGTDQEFDGVTTGVRSAASVPLISRGYRGVGQSAGEQILGVLTLLDQNDSNAFDSEDMELLRTLGSLMAVAIANARMEERRRTTFLRTLESLATALEARDEYTRGHSQRVCELSLMLGERLKFSVDALEELRVGTILHDIGKIGVPDAILNKRARLTDEEFLVMKTHPVIGYEICRPLMLSEGVLMIIRNHHEKLDGSGYPDGLKGGELPLSLRIVCVADAFDAMSSRRPYRGVMEIGDVLAELSRGAGTQFDPVVVETLKELLQGGQVDELYAQFWSGQTDPEARAA